MASAGDTILSLPHYDPDIMQATKLRPVIFIVYPVYYLTEKGAVSYQQE